MTYASTCNIPTQNHYFSLRTRFMLSMLVAFYIVIDWQERIFWKLLSYPVFYITVLSNFVLACLLIEFIHQMSKFLDRHFNWCQQIIKRFALQLLFATSLAIYLDLLLVKFFFWLFKLNLTEGHNMVFEFPIVKALVILMNVWYILGNINMPYFTNLAFIKKQFYKTNLLSQKISRLTVIHAKLGKRNRVIAINEIVCFKHGSSLAHVHLKDGSRWLVKHTTLDFLNMIGTDVCCQTNRGIIFFFQAVDSHYKYKKEGKIILKEGINLNMEVRRTISRDRYSGFKQGFEQYIKMMNNNGL